MGTIAPAMSLFAPRIISVNIVSKQLFIFRSRRHRTFYKPLSREVRVVEYLLSEFGLGQEAISLLAFSFASRMTVASPLKDLEGKRGCLNLNDMRPPQIMTPLTRPKTIALSDNDPLPPARPNTLSYNDPAPAVHTPKYFYT